MLLTSMEYWDPDLSRALVQGIEHVPETAGSGSSMWMNVAKSETRSDGDSGSASGAASDLSNTFLG